MKLAAAFILVISLSWVINPFVSLRYQWEMALFVQYLIVAVAVTGWFIETRGGMVYRSILAMLMFISWLDVASEIIWQYSGMVFDIGFPVFILMLAWFFYLAGRSYEMEGDEINDRDVFILLLRPSTPFDVLKAIFGLPVASVCIYHNGSAWAFRHAAGVYARNPAPVAWLDRHIAINTRCAANENIINSLNNKIGMRRGIGIRCIYQIKDVLEMIGKKPATPFHYIPGIFAMQLRGWK